MSKLSWLFATSLFFVACGSNDAPSSATNADGGSSNDGGASGSDGGGNGNDGGGGPAPIGGARLFFSDLESGPNTGGQDGKGAFVTVWGNGFGDQRGASTVTVGGGAVDGYPVWSSTKITFQLGAAAKTGDIVVHVAGKGDSNGLPFTVRTGNIFFVATGGQNANDGSFAKPWQTIPKAKNTIAAGDIAYILDGVAQTTLDNFNATLAMDANDTANSGTKDRPKALVAYPNATVTVGVDSGIQRGILVPAITGTFDFWVISQLHVHGAIEGFDLQGPNDGWRIVGNDITCPNGAGLSGCVTGDPTNLKFFGNVVHDAASKVSTITKYYHGIYFGSNHIELGWNVVRDGKTCRGIQFHDSGGPNEFDLVVHDNVIHGTVCDGLNFATVDPSKGAVVAYNNVIYDVGKGPDPADGSASYACIYVANTTNAGAPGSGNVDLHDNTLVDCGARGTSAAGAIAIGSGPVGVKLTNNLVLALGGESYFSGDTSKVSGSNNLFFGGAGAPPAALGATVTADPLLVDVTAHDFHLQPTSPAIDKGAATSNATDFDGNVRPQGAAFDIGAYERAK